MKQAQFTGVVQNGKDEKYDSKDDSFEVFACWNETKERSNNAQETYSLNAIVDTGATKTVIGEMVLEKRKVGRES